MKKEVLVIVAHPDDETIWVGGTLMSNDWNITIVSLCRKDDQDRAPKFFKVCNEYKAQCYISNLEDDYLHDIETREIITKIESLINQTNYDYIFTHGENGEYGHKRHVEIHNAVKKMVNEGLLTCEKIFFFSYSKKGKECHAKKTSDRFIRLKKTFSLKKKNLIKEIYGFNEKSFEEKCCKMVEAFNVVNIK